MAKIKVVGGAYAIISEYTLAQLKEVEKHRPKALQIADPETKNVEFVVSTGNSGSVSKYGMTFNETTRDEAGKACITMTIPADVEDAEKYIVETVGTAITKLATIEKAIEPAQKEIAEEVAAIKAAISIL